MERLKNMENLVGLIDVVCTEVLLALLGHDILLHNLIVEELADVLGVFARLPALDNLMEFAAVVFFANRQELLHLSTAYQIWS